MWKKIFNLKFWLPILVLGLGAGVTLALLNNKPKARKKNKFSTGNFGGGDGGNFEQSTN